MGETSRISWTDATFNPWSGCTKVSEGCKHCYAEREAARAPKIKGVWGPNGTRVARAESYWKGPLKWDADAASRGERRRVFCASIADVFEQWGGPIVDHHGYPLCIGGRMMTMDDIRLRLFDLIRQTPNLDWLLLTKRIESAGATLRRCADLCEGRKSSEVWGVLSWVVDWLNGRPPDNVWLGTSVEDQATADERIPHLLDVPAAVRWISAEPLLGPVDFAQWIGPAEAPGNDSWDNPAVFDPPLLDWIVVGGESGARDKARPFDLAWARSIRDQCKAAGVPCFIKQLGANAVAPDHVHGRYVATGGRLFTRSPYPTADRAGADPSEWPSDLHVQEYPR